MTECFRYFDGMPDEIVFDQDSIVCVSENSGDIILTYEFEKFRQQCGFKVYMCRAADPESKGKVENAGGRTAFDAAEQGDETAKAVVEQYIDYLADGISGIVNVFRPEVIVLGGGVSNQGASLLDPLNEKVAALCVASDTIEPPKVVKATLGNSAGIIGAGLLGF